MNPIDEKLLNLPAQGIYTPTPTNLVNISAVTFHRAVWTKVGKLVTVSGFWSSSAGFNETANFRIDLPQDLPIASVGSADDIWGYSWGAENNSTGNYNVGINNNNLNGTAHFDAFGITSSANARFWFQFSYLTR